MVDEETILSLINKIKNQFRADSIIDYNRLIEFIYNLLLIYDKQSFQIKHELQNLLLYISNLKVPTQQDLAKIEMIQYDKIYNSFVSTRLQTDTPYSKDIKKYIKQRTNCKDD